MSLTTLKNITGFNNSNDNQESILNKLISSSMINDTSSEKSINDVEVSWFSIKKIIFY